MPTPVNTVTCLSNERIAHEIYEFRFSKPRDFTFDPGQFVLFDVPLVENPSDVQTRSFSIASAPSEPDLLFAAKMKERGRASRWIVEVLKEGVETRMQGPTGLFRLRGDSEKDVLMIATSTGVAPFRSQLIALLPKESRRFDLVYGVRSEEDLFWVEELLALSQQYESFFLHLALSDPTGDWKGHRGRVQTLVPQIVQNFTEKDVYICGNPNMTKEVKGLCLEEWGVPKESVHAEGYI